MKHPIWSLNGGRKLGSESISVIQKKINFPEGSLIFYLKNEEVYKNLNLNLNIYELIGNGDIHKFTKEKNEFKYYYSSLSEGTRESKIEVDKVTGGKNIFVAFTWGAGKSKLYMGSKNPRDSLVFSEGISYEPEENLIF